MTTIKKINEDILGSQIKNGDKEAFQQVYNLYKHKIFGFALSYLKSRDEAEEIIQTVFVKLWETRSEIRDNVSLRNYLYKITVNNIYNYLKFKQIRLNANIPISEELDNSTIDSIDYNNLKANIDSLIEQLPEQRKIIFKLSRLEGLSHEKIADKMQLSVRTVESQVYKALKFLRKKLKEELMVILLFLPW